MISQSTNNSSKLQLSVEAADPGGGCGGAAQRGLRHLPGSAVPAPRRKKPSEVSMIQDNPWNPEV